LDTFFFFCSSRRRHTRFSRDWSSDVCSSDLLLRPRHLRGQRLLLSGEIRVLGGQLPGGRQILPGAVQLGGGAVDRCQLGVAPPRSEERRGGQECGSRVSEYEWERAVDRDTS